MPEWTGRRFKAARPQAIITDYATAESGVANYSKRSTAQNYNTATEVAEVRSGDVKMCGNVWKSATASMSWREVGGSLEGHRDGTKPIAWAGPAVAIARGVFWRNEAKLTCAK